MSRINTNVKLAIIHRLLPMTVTRTEAILNRDTGEYEDGTPVVFNTPDIKGCFQQINRFDNYLGDELAQLTEGERLEASTVLWTLNEVRRGEESTDVDSPAVKADIIYETKTGRSYKVLAVRNKMYGSFYRAILGEIRD